MTQQKLSYLIGIDRPILSKIENTNIPIDPDNELAVKISRILKALVTDIITNKHLIKEDYNPRKDLKSEDIEYKKIKRSIDEFDYVNPLIINNDMIVIGGKGKKKIKKV